MDKFMFLNNMGCKKISNMLLRFLVGILKLQSIYNNTAETFRFKAVGNGAGN